MKTQELTKKLALYQPFHSRKKVTIGSQKPSSSQSCLVHVQEKRFCIPQGLEHWKYFCLDYRQDKGPIDDAVPACSRCIQCITEGLMIKFLVGVQKCTLATAMEEAKSSRQKHIHAHRITCTADSGRWWWWKRIVSITLTVIHWPVFGEVHTEIIENLMKHKSYDMISWYKTNNGKQYFQGKTVPGRPTP